MWLDFEVPLRSIRLKLIVFREKLRLVDLERVISHFKHSFILCKLLVW